MLKDCSKLCCNHSTYPLIQKNSEFRTGSNHRHLMLIFIFLVNKKCVLYYIFTRYRSRPFGFLQGVHCKRIYIFLITRKINNFRCLWFELVAPPPPSDLAIQTFEREREREREREIERVSCIL